MVKRKEDSASVKEFIKGFIFQYLCELVAIAIAIGFYIHYKSIVMAIIISTVAFFMLVGTLELVNLFTKPSGCKLLQLTKRDEVCMKATYRCKGIVQKYFPTDFEKIINYAKNHKIYKLKIHTHEMILCSLLRKYQSVTKGQKYRTLKEGESTLYKSNIGTINVKYMGKKMIRCAKYQYGPILTFEQFKRTLRQLPFFYVEIELIKTE